MSTKVFIIQTEYGYAVSPSPVVVPRKKAALSFENLTNVPATISGIPDVDTLELARSGESRSTQSVDLPADTARVILYKVKMKGGLRARGNSAPIIIRDP